MDRQTPISGDSSSEQYSAPWPEAELLPRAMQIADTIRRYEKDQAFEATNATPKVLQPANNSSSDLLASMRKLLEVPGVLPGCIAAGFGIVFMIPARRTLIRVCDKYWNLGTTFPDLIVTPMLTIYVAQCSLWIGSLYGSSFYLNKLASFPVEAPSPTVDTICNDPNIINAVLKLPPPPRNPSLENQNYGTSLTSSFGEWDPREKLLSNLHDAVQFCQQRRKYYNKNGKDSQ